MTTYQYYGYLEQIGPIQKLFWGEGDKKGKPGLTKQHANELKRRHLGKGLPIYGK